MNTIQDIYNSLMGILDQLTYFIVSVALLAFLWGVFNYLFHAANAKKKQDASNYIVYGLLSLLVMLGVWGFVYMIGDTFNIKVGGSFGDSSSESTSGGDIFRNVDDSPTLTPDFGNNGDLTLPSNDDPQDNSNGQYGGYDYEDDL